MVILDGNGIVIYINPIAEKLLNLKHDSIVGNKIDIPIVKNELTEIEVVDKEKNILTLQIKIMETIWDNKDVIIASLRDITKQKLAEKEQTFISTILSILNRPNEWLRLVEDILNEIKNFTGFEAIGIRLKEGEDYPYFATHGFQSEFVEMERFLCARNSSGKIIRDSGGNPILECMCGNVISGRTDSSFPFFTKGGSFWSNNTTELLATTSDEERQTHTRNRCNGEGYESVALIPIHSGDEVIGLLQFNDKRTNRFTIELIEFFEKVGTTIGIAFKRMHAEKVIKESESKFRLIAQNSIDVIWQMDTRLKFTYLSPSLYQMTGYKPEEWVGTPLWKHAKFIDFMKIGRRALEALKTASPTDIIILESNMLNKEGKTFPVEITSKLLTDDKSKIVGLQGTIRDITERIKAEAKDKKNVERLRSLAEISQFQTDSIQDLLDFALNEAIKLTESKIGYIYHYYEDRKEFVLNTWSKGVMKECEIMEQPTIYQLEKTGLWGEAVRQRKPILSNDFQSPHPLMKGQPEGYAPLSKFLTIPIIIDGQIKAVVGVANKETDYDDTDILQLTLLMDNVWKIVERKNAVDELKASEERFRGLYENATIGMYQTSPDGKYLIANPAFISMLEYNSHEELLQAKNKNLIYYRNEDRELFYKILKDENLVHGFESEWITATGKIIWVRESATAYTDKDGNLLYFEGTAEDVTEQKTNEIELVSAKERAEKSDKLKSEFLAQMSHEIRTPINAMMNFAELLKEDIKSNNTEYIEEEFAGIKSSGKRIIRTIDLILNMSEIQTDTFEPIFKQINLYSDVLKKIMREFKTLADSKNLELNINDPSEDSIVLADEYSVSQIFANLIDNAIKYTAKGKIDVYLKKNEKGECLVEVTDTGIGISQEFIPKLFNAFVQEHQGYTRRFEGNGLGLALVKKYCDINKASIEVESEKDKGTKFTVTFNK